MSGPLKRYLLFAGYDYSASGGWDDFVGAFDTYEEATAAEFSGDWWHVVDCQTGEEVKK